MLGKIALKPPNKYDTVLMDNWNGHRTGNLNYVIVREHQPRSAQWQQI